MAQVFSGAMAGMNSTGFGYSSTSTMDHPSHEDSSSPSISSSGRVPSGSSASLFTSPGTPESDVSLLGQRSGSGNEPMMPSGFAEAMKRRTSADGSGPINSHKRRGPSQLSDLNPPELQREDSSTASAHPNLQQFGSAPLTRTQFQGHTPRASTSATGAGHRRKGSELIGSADQDRELLSTDNSPTKGLRLGPSASPSMNQNRRGHAHRRSTAISDNDVARMLSSFQSSQAAGTTESVPASPSLPFTPRMPGHPSSLHRRSRSIVQPSNMDFHQIPLDPGARRASTSDAGNPVGAQTSVRRIRVGFAPQVQYIPRPLSTISSDSGSIRTLAPRHSATGSLSSVTPSDISSPLSSPSINQPSIESLPAIIHEDSGSTTKEPVASPPVARRTRSFGELLHGARKRPSNIALPSTSIESAQMETTSVRRLFGRLSPLLDYDIATKPSYFSDSAIDDSSNDESVDPVPLSPTTIPADQSQSPQRREARTRQRKPKKARRWGHSLLGAQSKADPPVPMGQGTGGQPNVESVENHEAVGSASRRLNELGQAAAPTFNPLAMLGPLFMPTSTESSPMLSPKRSNSTPESANISPVIDLDAALGPYNTPPLGREFTDPKNSGFAVKARRMHSGGEREQHNAAGPFLSNPNMARWHKRTVSAPAQANDGFDWGEYGFHENPGQISMPDVAEEMEDSIDESTRHNVYSAPVPGKIVHSQLQGDVQAQSGSLDAPAYAHRYWGSVSLQQFQAEPFMGGPGEEEVDGHSQTFMGGPGDENTAINGEPFMGGPGDEIEDEQPFAGGPGDEDVGEEAGPRDYSIQEGPGDEVVKYSSEPLNGVSRRPSSDGQASDSTTHTLKADSERPTTVKHNDGSRRSQIPYLQPPTPTSAASSAIPSPDFIPPSFDEPRLLTAGSSFTDEYPYGSTRYSEIVAYETRCSVSDVPSLIGSLSSHTSGVNIATLNQLTRPSAVRSMSENLLETDQHLRPSLASHKRASLMSLTRLIHSSPSKSKLSLETSALGEDEPMRQAKRHRFSRLLQFWRTKNAA